VPADGHDGAPAAAIGSRGRAAWAPKLALDVPDSSASEQNRRRPLRVGHKGAAALVAGNTLASFDAALELGVDMIELDVLSERTDGGGELLVAHDYEDLGGRAPLTLAQALEHLSSPAFAAVELDLDVKLPGYELRVLDALRGTGLVERTLISGMFPSALARVRAAEPSLRLGWSLPRVRRDYTNDMLTAIPAFAVLTGYRAALPRRAGAAIASGAVDAIMAHWRVVTPALLRAVRTRGGQLFVWTVDDAERIAKLSALGVDGIITNDPRLFEAREGLLS
jgi:glycerophosphoryl diester phosphodiesterase